MGHPRVETVAACGTHILPMVAAMREEDRAEVLALGEQPALALYRLCRFSPIRRSVFVEGRIAAMWGCSGTLMSPVGEAWMLTTPEVERVPIAFLKTARQGVAEMLEIHSVIVSAVMASYARSIRFQRLLGFTVGEPVPVPPYGVAFCRLRLERGA